MATVIEMTAIGMTIRMIGVKAREMAVTEMVATTEDIITTTHTDKMAPKVTETEIPKAAPKIKTARMIRISSPI